MSYAAGAIAAVEAELPGLEPDLVRLYALLALTRGERTTPADVHDAWALYTASTRPDHPCLVPSGQLDPSTRGRDEMFTAGIRKAAHRLSATMSSASAPAGAAALPDGHRGPVIRVAAVGDLHVRDRPADLALGGVREDADVLLLAGDVTHQGSPEQARRFADQLAELAVPIIGVLGNHDIQMGCQDAIVDILNAAGVRVLDGASVVLPVHGVQLGVAGVTGFGGGFPGGVVHEFGEPEVKHFAARGRVEAQMLAAALGGLDDGPRVALTHYSPAADTLDGEPRELYPVLGSRLLGEAIDRAGVTLAVHGHAHHGIEHGRTAGGVPVRNVARPVIQAAYRVYLIHRSQNHWAVADASQAATHGGDRVP